jgi:hypothetical protein
MVCAQPASTTHLVSVQKRGLFMPKSAENAETELIEFGEHVLGEVQRVTSRLHARQEYRRERGRRLSKADLDGARRLVSALEEAHQAMGLLLGAGNRARLAAIRHRARAALLDLDD